MEGAKLESPLPTAQIVITHLDNDFMRTKKIMIAFGFFILLIHSIAGQGLPIEIVIKEVNRQIFHTDGQLARPDRYTRWPKSNKPRRF